MMPRLTSLALAATLLLGAAGAYAAAPGSSWTAAQQENRQQVNRGRISSAEAATIVRQRFGGEVMNVSTRQEGNITVYRVKILQSSGHMRTVSVNAETGAIMN
ncbi:PepSY domain-containing protein [Marinimicrobium alkaliphilum]|uniref:PepSY domain-containing protein n=1 Tax=Marinimicrobium alkaliphilum TaxID=2202654 RepID=UPI000DB9F154|nr:PepSY domain-containing protein [Marinimicrobium alkaliphilum]